MKPAAMHEHRGDDRHRVGTRFAGKSCGNERPVLDELVASVEFDKKDYNIQRNQRIGDDGKRTALRVVVTNRKHPWTASLQEVLSTRKNFEKLGVWSSFSSGKRSAPPAR